MKSSDGFTKLGPSVLTIVTALASFGLLSVAMRELPLGTAYAVWTGIGAVGAFVFGIVMMGEALSAARVASAALIVVGLIGLKLSSAA
jgi:quaternary ammonium compound-resistance protein SugE